MKSALAMDALRGAVGQLPKDRLSGARTAALEHLHENGTPTVRHEDWKYTNLDDVIDISNHWLAGGARTIVPDDIASSITAITRQFDAYWFVIANGIVDSSCLEAARPAGLEIAHLSESDAVLNFEAPLADLNTALLHDGLHVRVSSDFADDKPIAILIFDDATADIGVSQARIEIDIAPQARASFIEYHASAGASRHYSNTVINLGLNANAAVAFVRIQDRDGGHAQTNRLSATLNRDSTLRHSAFDLGGKLIRNDLHIDLSGSGSRATISGLYFGDTEQHIDNHTRIDHLVGPSRSVQEYRGILSGAARCIWNGKAVVHAGADGTDAEQSNHNLLLSEQAEIDAKPELEIYADDVKCAHGTSIGQLDENALYYLRTRGLEKREARQLLTSAFAQSIVSGIPVATVQELVGDLVATRLGQLVEGQEQ